MYFLLICTLFPVIDSRTIVQLHRQSIYQSNISCSLVHNQSISKLNDCIRLCQDDYRCQTAVYFKDKQICSLFTESCQKNSIKPTENITATVICCKKNSQLLPTCASTTTPQPVFEPASLWSFDNNTNDSISNYHGVLSGSPIYRSPGINGYGSTLWFDAANNQFVNVPTYRNLSYRSFTVQMWFFSTNTSSYTCGFFGQRHAANADESLHYVLRNGSPRLCFFSDDLQSSTIIQINTWYHITFVYNYSSFTQSIYRDGMLDCNRTSNNPYQSMSGLIVIGKTEQQPGTPWYFSGAIDEVLLSMKAKTASEILDDATLVTYHSFDSQSYYDASSLRLKGTYANVTFSIGKVNQAIDFQSNSSFYEIDGFFLLGHANRSYSILPSNVWSHIAYTYSSNNGLRLYVNGTLMNTTGSGLQYICSGELNTLVLANARGNRSSCYSQSIASDPYSGSLDELRVYSRELATDDIYVLSHP
ncbi:unnamed protein product [Adineta ricciae]|uniref:Uncharacterized protein n=1 Tax=Adineta ricciae TaxID=249248 RepID=A0A814YP78_ADIRI|nr:unnamed protein product [Adineta ricciae]